MKNYGRNLNVGYAGIFATYWMVYGVIGSFGSAFLLNAGYSNSEIGIIFAVASVISCFTQPILADISDRSKKLNATSVAEILSAALIILTGLLFVINHKSAALFVIYALAMAWILALQPLFNSLCFRFEESGHHINFGICRSIGSLGYAVLVAVLGTLVENSGMIVIPETSVLSLILLMIALILTEKTFRKSKDEKGGKITAGEVLQEEPAQDDINLLEFVKRNKLFVVLNLGIVLLFFQNYITNNYMFQIVEGVGGDAEDMGRIFSVMAFIEMPGLFFFDNIRKKFNLKFLLRFASVNFVLKLAALTFANSVAMVYAAHFFHIFSFSIFLAAIVAYINEIMEKGEAVKGQALYTASITVSSIFASIFGGILLDISGPKMMLLISTLVAAFGTVVIWILIGKIGNNK